MELGRSIKEKRKLLRLSAEDLAIQLNLKKDNIYKWERGAMPSNPEEYKIITGWLKNSENIPQETDSVKQLESLLSVLVSELAALKESLTGENAAVIVKKIYKAAEELAKV